MDFITQFGIRIEHKEDAARLYAIAFQTKFLKILGSPEEVTQLLIEGINIQRGISAISADSELLGISGFKLDNTSLIDIKFRTYVSKYGIIKGILKYVVLAAIFYRKPNKKSQLLMDGIAVKEGNRGRGIGKQLFIALEKFSIHNNLTSIRLDVIDENPKAKKLYESIGFVQTSYSKTPDFIYKLIGIRGFTTMVKEL